MKAAYVYWFIVRQGGDAPMLSMDVSQARASHGLRRDQAQRLGLPHPVCVEPLPEVTIFRSTVSEAIQLIFISRFPITPHLNPPRVPLGCRGYPGEGQDGGELVRGIADGTDTHTVC